MNEYLMSFYEEYNKSKTINKLIEFTTKTFPQDGTDKLFIGCTLILITNAYKTRTTAEALKNIISCVNEPAGNTNLLDFYVHRVNGNKLISKYLINELNDKNLKHHADIILNWIDNFCFDFKNRIQDGYKDKISDYKKE